MAREVCDLTATFSEEAPGRASRRGAEDALDGGEFDTEWNDRLGRSGQPIWGDDDGMRVVDRRAVEWPTHEG